MTDRHFLPATADDMTRISVASAKDTLLIAIICLFSILSLGAAVVAMPSNWRETRIAHAEP